MNFPRPRPIRTLLNSELPHRPSGFDYIGLRDMGITVCDDAPEVEAILKEGRARHE